MASAPDEVGRTADVGYQIGVSRTIPFSEEAIWGLLLSPEGLATWLGGPIEVEEGARYTLADGASGEVRVYKPWSHLRLTWQPPGWARASLVQVRVIPTKTGTTLSFHQEHLQDGAARTEMKGRWERVIEALTGKLKEGEG
jgi:uncharacterized protein YndB with AHSA1/START domain